MADGSGSLDRMPYCPSFVTAAYDGILAAAYRDPYDPTSLARIERTLSGGIFPGCEAYGQAFANAAQHMRAAQAAAVGEERRHVVPGGVPRPSWYGRRLGRQTTSEPMLLLGAPGESPSAIKYRQWQAAAARGVNPRAIAVLRAQFEALFEQERLARELQRRPALANVAGWIGQAASPSFLDQLVGAADTALRGYRALGAAAEGIRYGRDAAEELSAAVRSLTAARDAASAALSSIRQVTAAVQPSIAGCAPRW